MVVRMDLNKTGIGGAAPERVVRINGKRNKESIALKGGKPTKLVRLYRLSCKESCMWYWSPC